MRRTTGTGQGIRFDYSLTSCGFAHGLLLVTLLGPDILFPIPINQRARGFALLNQKRVAAEMWDPGFSCGMGGSCFGINLPGIHPFEIIATVADANAGPENCYFSSRAMNDGNSNLPRRALCYQNRHVQPCRRH